MAGHKDIEVKVEALTNEVFTKYGKINEKGESGREEYITKEDLQDFLMGILVLSGDADAWDQHKYDKAFLQID